jgi:DNA processing protein
LLRLTLGASKSLELLIERAPAVRISKLLQDSEHAEIAAARFGKLTVTIADGLERWMPRLSKTEVENALKVAAACRANFVSPEHEEWPSGLSDLGLAMPAGLWVRGSLERIAPALAIVGSRTATSYGAWVCAEFVSALADRSVAVVSGGAFGIDAAAHRAANAMGAPNFAVMAGGVDRFYPSSNNELLREVTANGAVLAELPPGARPTRWRFLQRNRLIAALGRATVVVEAGHRSGAINTANHALAIGRNVGAVPGTINIATSEGCHRLIREGTAQLVASNADLFELIGLSRTDTFDEEPMGALELRALDALTARFQNQVKLLEKAGLTSLELAIALGALELSGRAERDEHGFWRKRLNL